MINSKELRIGNFVQVEEEDGDRYEYPVYSIDKDYILVGEKQPKQPSMDRVHPIPLTEARKLGLPEMVNGYNYTQYSISDGEVWAFGDGSERLDHIKFIHQWQNLHFSLTGEEMPIKTTP